MPVSQLGFGENVNIQTKRKLATCASCVNSLIAYVVLMSHFSVNGPLASLSDQVKECLRSLMAISKTIFETCLNKKN